jgi:AcrR family transcriptional regulator
MESNLTGSDDLKIRLIDEARAIFARFGYNKTTVDDIARTAGKGKSTFYYYFKSKEEIFKAVLDKEAEILRIKLLAAINTNKSAIEKIKDYIFTRFESFIELVNYYNVIRFEDIKTLSLVDEIRGKYDVEQTSMIKSVLAEGILKNEVKAGDTDLVTDTIAVILTGLEYHMIFRPDDGKFVKPKIDKVIDIVFEGIAN